MNSIRLLKPTEIQLCPRQVKEGRNGDTKVMLLMYKDARVDYAILDETFGIYGWQCNYEVLKGNLFCTISIYDSSSGTWVKKSNVGTESSMEAEKGEASDALKRAGTAVGIGRELYTAPSIWISLSEKECDKRQAGKPAISAWVEFHVKDIKYDDSRYIKDLTIVDSDGKVRYTWSSKVTATSEPKAEETALPQAPAQAPSNPAKDTPDSEPTAVDGEWSVEPVGGAVRVYFPSEEAYDYRLGFKQILAFYQNNLKLAGEKLKAHGASTNKQITYDIYNDVITEIHNTPKYVPVRFIPR